MVKLKPCPFCNSSAMSHTDSARSVVGCFYAECGVNPSLSAITIELASEVWNKRVSDRLVEENAELREVLSGLIRTSRNVADTINCSDDERIKYMSFMTAANQLLNK